ncbi:hypothetical protein [Sphingomicrobium sediminis]|uniref:Uncharacterized protein n=1 Tax=Sphingomicrobium sediminis TaxID=2950949 RepID=A0A9X2EML2_9SPHN|nr:hypothetical protein [Sphingomicrobium sediminis]MCM8558184.1 hypothetical protein [Sphingomicrobium sediminis]
MFISYAVAAALAMQPAETPPEPTIIPQPISFDASGLSEPGAAMIEDELADQQFIAVGEAHGHADAPLLLAALAAEAKPHGFDHYAVEMGPNSAEWVMAFLRDEGVDGYGAALAGKALSIPFLGMREEAEAALPFATSGKMWGIDQEFILSTLIHYPWLIDRAPDDDTRAVVQGWLDTDQEAMRTGNQGMVTIMTVPPADFLALRAAYGEDAEATARLVLLARSAGIYQYYRLGRGLDNNLDRIALMKEQFTARYAAEREATGEAPRVIMKMGAIHAGAATSSMNTFDIGSLIEGMAAAEGREALQIAYLPLGGEATAIMPSPEGIFSVRPASNEELAAALEQAGVDMDAIAADGGHVIIPLDPVRRALRNTGLEALDQDTRFIILGFDYLITTRAASASTPLANF